MNIPGAWLEQSPALSDGVLSNMINKICHYHEKPMFWLRGFDPILYEGLSGFHDLRTASRRVSSLSAGVGPKAQQLRETMRVLQWRATSWAGDEAICFALILNLDVETVQKAPVEDRMAVLVSMWQEAPSQLAFSDLKRMSRPGFTWMPQSILGVGLDTSAVRYEIVLVFVTLPTLQFLVCLVLMRLNCFQDRDTLLAALVHEVYVCRRMVSCLTSIFMIWIDHL